MVSGGRGGVGEATTRPGVASAGDETLASSLASSVAPATAFGGIESSGGERGGREGGGFVRFAVVRFGDWEYVWR